MCCDAKLFVNYFSLFFSIITLAQNPIVQGRVIDTHSSKAIGEVQVYIKGSRLSAFTLTNGTFKITNKTLPRGEQILIVSKEGYLTLQLPIVVQAEHPINIDPILLEPDLTQLEAQIGLIALSNSQLDQENNADYNISGLLQASRDVFLNAAAFDFSATFFRPRGYDSANGKVLINGIAMNKQFSGRPQWANWGGLNDAQRNREFSMGLKANEYTFGDLAGTTNIVMRASQYRKGGRISYAFANRSYRGRIMGSYHSGTSLSGWAYSVLISRRFGDQGYVRGTFYDANSLFVSVEKRLHTNHSINLSGLYTPNRRGRSAPLTQEVYNLKGRKYNPNWGWLGSKKRNSRVREIGEPIIMINHYWKLNNKTTLNTNLAYQFGTSGSTRIDNGGTRLLNFNAQESYLGGARNPSPDYYQRLPSFFLQSTNPSPYNYQQAFLAEQEFLNNGQLDWDNLYHANQNSAAAGGNSIYVLQEDRTDDTQFTVNTILSSPLSTNITLNATLNYRALTSENFASIKDLLGGAGYLDVDFFAEDDANTIVGDLAQSDLRNRNRIVGLGARYKYNYELRANVISVFAQSQFKYNKIDFYLASSFEKTNYQRTGLYENGNFPGTASFGASKKLNFTNLGFKGGATYKVTGRHLFDLNAGYFSKAPSLRNSFSNARQNNHTVIGITEEKIQHLDLSYIYRSPTLKGRLTGFYTEFKDGIDLGFYFTQDLSGFGINKGNAFVQEVLTGINKRHMGVEFGAEAQLTPTLKLKAAASIGQYTYSNNPNLYLTSDDFQGPLQFGDGTANLQNYNIAGGPERAYQIGFEYRDPEFWWIGLTANYFSHAFIDIAAITRTANFSSDYDGLPFNNYEPEIAKKLLKQEQLGDYFLVNVVGGKSWRIKRFFVGFFATVNNVLDQEYITGGFEQSRNSNYRSLLADRSRTNGPIFGNRYFFGNGTTYYLNFYLRF